jgi:hypothetical protein
MMNLLSDLSSELALAILVEKRHRERVASNEAKDLIRSVREVLGEVSADPKVRRGPATDSVAVAGH